MSGEDETRTSPHYERRRDGYLISTDPARLDVDAIQRFLAERAYWAQGRPREVVERSLAHSLCFGLYAEALGGAQVGLARVVSDFATFAWLCDVYVLEAHRGRGLGVWLVGAVVAHPDLRGLRRMMLATRDAHGLYRRFGFRPLAAPERWMERLDPQAHAAPPAAAARPEPEAGDAV